MVRSPVYGSNRNDMRTANRRVTGYRNQQGGRGRHSRCEGNGRFGTLELCEGVFEPRYRRIVKAGVDRVRSVVRTLQERVHRLGNGRGAVKAVRSGQVDPRNVRDPLITRPRV